MDGMDGNRIPAAPDRIDGNGTGYGNGDGWEGVRRRLGRCTATAGKVYGDAGKVYGTVK
jgi:hypothetical protein